jgi:Outer membrane protein beta-barrel domain
MQKPSLCLFALALLAASACARADDGPDAPFYVGVGVGHVSLNHDGRSLTPTNAGGIDGTGTAESVSGGYWLTDYLAVELGYHDYGTPTAFNQSGTLLQFCPQTFSCPKVTGLTGELVGRYQLVPDLYGELLVGGLDWHVGSPGSAFLTKTTGTDLVYGLRVSHSFGNGWNADVTYERSQFITEETRLGVSYSF